MSNSITKSLIINDWYFNRVPLLLLNLVAVISLILFSIDSKGTFYVGLVLLISALATSGALLVIITVVNERKKRTLPFVMSLPISFVDYTKAKLISNISAFFLTWFIVTAGTLVIIYYSDHLQNGLLPISSIILVELFIGFILVLATALVSESEAWTIGVMSVANIGISLFIFWIGSLQGIEEYISGPQAIWNSTAITILAIEFASILLVVLITFYLQSRKTDFL